VKKILQVNFKHDKSNPKFPETMRAIMASVPRFAPGAEFKGLIWKIWARNEAEDSAAGIYLFEDDASVEAYLKGELFSGFRLMPGIVGIETKVFDVMLEPTKVSHGPVDVEALARK
jgi:hypothetical protein